MTALPVGRLAIPVLIVVVAAVLGLRARLGLDLGDGTHAVELSMRLARGDQPFRDEMNLQVLGAWPAVPFVWVWLHTVGVDGIVLASRVYFVLLALAGAALAWRAVGGALGRVSTGVAAVAAVVPTAYNLQLVGYNTTPALLYLVAASSAVGAMVRGAAAPSPASSVSSVPSVSSVSSASSSRWPVVWAVVAGAAAALGAVSHPVTAPAGVLLLLVSVLWARGRVRLALVGGAAGASLVVAALAVALWGVSQVRETLAFTADYQSARVDRVGRVAGWLGYLGGELAQPAVLLALGLGIAAGVALSRRSRLAGPLLLGAVALTAGTGLTRSASSATFSVSAWLSPVMALVLSLVLLPAAVVSATLLRGAAVRLLTVGAIPSAVGAVCVAGFTASSPTWGAVGSCLAPGVFAVIACALSGLLRLRAPAGADSSRRRGAVARWSTAAVGSAVLVALLASHVATSFRDGPVGRLDAAAPTGAYAGLLTTDRRAADVAAAQGVLRSCATTGSSVLAIGYPAAYLMGDVRFATPVTWLADFGPSTSHLVRWFDERGTLPDCVVRPARWWQGSGGAPEADPLRAWVEARYVTAAATPTLVVLRRTDR
ncbi:hypothetical protein FHX52_0082 [Humibacillus xanthopallidus]|uniref:4-amino-4-deoxy-L-arabinose transferase-like glycosyltransferase n=1 Tax=Humibacillus xanthopallidus TaxID=412689 RepID=A0A543PSD0_9MICO|nr:hypothetical protein [Humibacillus xanthopallidus]TQN46992.1 hypothetical protein FHX52_0082 [Humibacillus xanthopallidus]